MSLFGVFYEFKLSKDLVRHLVEELKLTQPYSHVINKDVVANTLDFINVPAGSSAGRNYYVGDRPEILLNLSRELTSDRLPHPIEGAYFRVHPSSEGFLKLQEFEMLFEGFLERHGIAYKKYKKSTD
jgi:hypothetical protein